MMVASESSYDISICVNLESLPSNIGKMATLTITLHFNRISVSVEELAEKIALLKRNCFASVFDKYFDLQAEGGVQKTAIIHYRDQETMLVHVM